MELEKKFCKFGDQVSVTDGMMIKGYASLFDQTDQGGDVVQKGAFAKSLAHGRSVRMLWQHDPTQPIGVWDELREDAKGLFVRGHLLDGVARAREAAELIAAAAIEGLSIGYRTIKATKHTNGQRLLQELELWEVSLVTFPMLPSAKVGTKREDLIDPTLHELAEAINAARLTLGRAP